MKVFSSKTQQTGKIAEDIATKFLVKQGWRILERNYTKPYGEIDIIAEHNKRIHFVEVKSLAYKTPKQDLEIIKAEENLHNAKFRRLTNTISVYLSDRHVSHETLWQIDLVVVQINFYTKMAKIKYFRNINKS